MNLCFKIVVSQSATFVISCLNNLSTFCFAFSTMAQSWENYLSNTSLNVCDAPKLNLRTANADLGGISEVLMFCMVVCLRKMRSINSSAYSMLRCCRAIGSDCIVYFSLLIVSNSRASLLIDVWTSSLISVVISIDVRGAD